MYRSIILITIIFSFSFSVKCQENRLDSQNINPIISRILDDFFEEDTDLYAVSIAYNQIDSVETFFLEGYNIEDTCELERTNYKMSYKNHLILFYSGIEKYLFKRSKITNEEDSPSSSIFEPKYALYTVINEQLAKKDYLKFGVQPYYFDKKPKVQFDSTDNN